MSAVPRPPKLHMPVLTNLPLDKMAAILADDIFKRIFLNENVRILIHISLKFAIVVIFVILYPILQHFDKNCIRI